MSLKSQHRLAADILNVGEGRVRINPDRIEEVEAAITREEIKRLIHEDVIKVIPKKGVSRARARALQERKKKGRGRGEGRKSGATHAGKSKKQEWMKRIRPLRKKLRELKTSRVITQSTYRKLYGKAGSGEFKSIADLEHFIEAHGLRRRR